MNILEKSDQHSAFRVSERKENVMRLHIAKSRFFKKGTTIKIATDYDNEVFYDSQRTDSLTMEELHNLPNKNATTYRMEWQQLTELGMLKQNAIRDLPHKHRKSRILICWE